MASRRKYLRSAAHRSGGKYSRDQAKALLADVPDVSETGFVKLRDFNGSYKSEDTPSFEIDPVGAARLVWALHHADRKLGPWSHWKAKDHELLVFSSEEDAVIGRLMVG